MCHIIGSLWHFISVLEINYLETNNSWIQNNSLQNEPTYVRYLESFYFAAATVMLIGTKGDTSLEVLFVTSTLLVTVGVFAYLLSTISQIIQDYDQEKTQYKRDLGIINKYMNSKKLDQEIQSRVQNFLEYQYKASEKINLNKDANAVMDKLPKYFREEMSKKINVQILEKFEFILKVFSKKTQDSLTQVIEEQHFITNETMFLQDITQEINLYFIYKGKVDIFQERDEARRYNIFSLGQNKILGDINFITGQIYDYTAKCAEFTTVYKINYIQFLEIIQNNPEDYQRYHQLKDQYLHSRYSNQIQRECQICQRNIHIEQDCNLICYRPKVLQVFLKSQYSQFMERSQNLVKQRRLNKITSLNGDLLDYLYNVQIKLEDDPKCQEYFNIFIDYEEDLYQNDESFSQSSVSESTELEDLENNNKQQQFQFTKNRTIQEAQESVTEYTPRRHTILNLNKKNSLHTNFVPNNYNNTNNNLNFTNFQSKSPQNNSNNNITNNSVLNSNNFSKLSQIHDSDIFYQQSKRLSGADNSKEQGVSPIKRSSYQMKPRLSNQSVSSANYQSLDDDIQKVQKAFQNQQQRTQNRKNTFKQYMVQVATKNHGKKNCKKNEKQNNRSSKVFKGNGQFLKATQNYEQNVTPKNVMQNGKKNISNVKQMDSNTAFEINSSYLNDNITIFYQNQQDLEKIEKQNLDLEFDIFFNWQFYFTSYNLETQIKKLKEYYKRIKEKKSGGEHNNNKKLSAKPMLITSRNRNRYQQKSENGRGIFYIQELNMEQEQSVNI